MVPALKSDVYEMPPLKPRPETVTVRVRRPSVSPFVVVPLVGLLLLAAGAGFVALRVQVMALGYELADAKQELARVQQEHTRLAVAVAQSRSLERVEQLARTRLGMVEPEPAAVVVVASPDGWTAPPAGGAAVAAASPLAAFGEWLHARISSTAEAGGRDPGR
ncbi:MAG: cell division protein FtsL [Limnochordales bacterium]